MSISDDKKLETLNDHYKDTFAQIRDYISLRDKLLIWILLVAAVMLFEVFSPSEAGLAIAQFASEKVGLNGALINTSFIGSVIWFLMLVLTMKYFQTVGLIEKHYDYIEKVEDAIRKNYDGATGIFSREGRHYLENYPLFSDWSWLLYTIIFPILLVAVLLYKIYNEVFISGCSVIFYINLLIFICIVTSTILYLRMLHFKK
ncbi:MAG: hypothetical protein UW81_C0024G0001 [Candidatus Giovannonibacteria bacterium GW2011_GWC2_44_9]|uniref:Uncharacterized protein n=3 Tax=Candidatus Giovannoniibacteriota TaxID=1752738 RepID=A0A0G1LW20_9BACT|nr:MAG: hypothetical protein UW49_C0004G0045 [Candidatus Giovannonibacteria bacterium GW2011_GWB1_44_23]KKT63934.1 MAG: hypothetical protein UW57_C0004G0044 [Candidatus Giovannonibacteria bacterium GW2011_GWA1_44_29]KKT83153.1 MAG: hypothetical protein UW81_C0024G0001 [Candidatus Giovannonibacteria bacterium GW2011_GWC2_44_9]KKT91647.1 MAG: hypothetical protein UW93_C0004G0045 [Parcubacteria group bacterium GW2011_GWC1_45_13]